MGLEPALTDDQVAKIGDALDHPDQRFDWSGWSNAEMAELAILADRYGRVGLLRKVRRATLHRHLREIGA